MLIVMMTEYHVSMEGHGGSGGVVIGTGLSVAAKLYNNALWPASAGEAWPGLFPELFPKWISEVNQPMAKVTVLFLVVAFIMVRPSGLFVAKERVHD